MNNLAQLTTHLPPSRTQNNDDFPAFVNPTSATDEGGHGVSYRRPRLPTQPSCKALRGNPLQTVMLSSNWGSDCTLPSFDEQGSGGGILVVNAGPELHPAGEYLSKRET